MSSVYDNPLYGGPFSSSKAVDGNKDPVALKPDNSCSITLSEANPWWAVDLGAPLAVGGIVFTTAANNLGTYAEFFFFRADPIVLETTQSDPPDFRLDPLPTPPRRPTGDDARLPHTHHTATVLRSFFRDNPGEPAPEENFWIL